MEQNRESRMGVRGEAQVVECLPSVGENLCSISSIIKTENQEIELGAGG
jgi:hypothetical protein